MNNEGYVFFPAMHPTIIPAWITVPKKAFILLFKCTSQVIEHVSQDHRILQLIHAYQISFLKAPN